MRDERVQNFLENQTSDGYISFEYLGIVGGGIMKTKLFVIALLVAGLVFAGYSNGYSQALGSPKLEGKPPIITSFYAPGLVSNGDPLRIYVAAEDPDGDMLRVAVSVSQLGLGDYPTDWTYLKSGDQKSFKGYLQWNTMSSRASILPERTHVTVKVSVFDKSGNESNEVVMPMVFVSSAVSYPPAPAPFDNNGVHRLGYIYVRLVNPYRDSDRGRDNNIILLPF